MSTRQHGLQGFYGHALPEDFGLQHAGEFLANDFGASYKYVWGLGLLAAGQASTMSGTYTGKLTRTLQSVVQLLQIDISSHVSCIVAESNLHVMCPWHTCMDYSEQDEKV